MKFAAMTRRLAGTSRAPRAWPLLIAGGLLAAPAGMVAQSDHYAADAPRTNDPRVGLKPGLDNAGEAIEHLKLVAHQPRPASFFDSATAGKHEFVNADLAFSGNYIFQGNYNGLQIWDMSNPKKPTLRTAVVCPGGQGDPRFTESPLHVGRGDARPPGLRRAGRGGHRQRRAVPRRPHLRYQRPRPPEAGRRRSDLPRLAHPHPGDGPERHRQRLRLRLGTSVVRREGELAGCSGRRPDEDPNTSLFRIDVIKVPLASPQDAKIVNSPRALRGFRPATSPASGRAAITARARRPPPRRTSATTSPSSGGRARCRRVLGQRHPARHPRPGQPEAHRRGERPELRLLALGDLQQRRLEGALYRRMGRRERWPAAGPPTRRNGARTRSTLWRMASSRRRASTSCRRCRREHENCVAHNGSLIPVPGRDIMVQAWYQGGLSVFDFTDPAHPVEIAFFDRGPASDGAWWTWVATGPRTGTTATSSAPRSHAGWICSSSSRATSSRRTRSRRRSW